MSENWTTSNIPDLTGKVMIVTGANSGLGFETAKEFARKGAHTILACRSLDKAEAARSQLVAEIPAASLDGMALDLASLASVRQFASDFSAKFDRLDVLVNNAGIMMSPYSTTEDGFESQFGINHLAHFALTGLLIDCLRQTPGARVVTVGSSGHRSGTLDFDNLMFEDGRDYSPAAGYGRSKLANIMFAYELQRRLAAAGVDALSLAAHPGGAQTNIGRHMAEKWYFRLFLVFFNAVLAQTAAMGALPTLRAATDPGAKGGEYYGPGGFMQQKGYPTVVKSNDASYNEADAKRLWEVSAELTGVNYLS